MSAGGSLAGMGSGRNISSFGASQGAGYAIGQGGGFGFGQGGGFGVSQGADFGGSQGGGFRSGYAGGLRSGLGPSFLGSPGGSGGVVPGDSYGPGFRGPVSGGGGYFGGPGPSFPGDYGAPEGLFPGNEKQTMQNLNDRLSTYLEKVRALEAANTDLETKIRDWYEKQITSGTIGPDPDQNKYFETIAELRSKIQSPSIDNAKLVLQIDNARLAADDFRIKYENELYFHQSVQADINGLRRILEEQNMARAELEVQIETMTEELSYLKTNHQEELKELQGQAAGQVNVEIDAAPGVALTKRLKDMRADYEVLTEKNRMEAEQWFIQKSLELKREMTKGVEEVQTTTTEVSEQRRLAQSVETEMQSQLAMKKSIEDSLIETENRYGVQLMQIQLIITTTEEQLSQVRGDMERQKTEYQQLLDIKVRLEREIETYRRLLDEEG
ncbi:hypothetical protein NDU88_002184 [Pleurodeles waltl]|uniref:IF rod domain-containing protein n=2 Tax=Pleurodeles waltl TaxID=8319 RepID=A0AAV7Q956_PLEWA|nr:hypothetical protein NDU88_002184 [Pleurodeles waltl]